MYKKITLAISALLISSNLYATNHIENGDFNSPIYKYENSPDSWNIQDSDSGGYSGLVTRKYDSQTNNNYVEIRSQNAVSNLPPCSGGNCHRAEIFYKPDRFINAPEYLNYEHQRTEITFKFRLDQIWDKNVGVCQGTVCRATIMQYLSPSSASYPVAPMMSIVLSRYNQTGGKPSLNLQHKVHCDKPENKINYASICAGNTGIAHWASDTFMPLKTNQWYEIYSHVYWSEDHGSFSAGLREVGGNWSHFAKGGELFHRLPTRADDTRHFFKAGIYGYGPVDSTTTKELILSFDDFKTL